MSDGIDSDFSAKQEIVLGGSNAIETPEAENNASVEIYSLSGNCIYKGNANEAPQLSKGTYVVRQSGKTRKVLVK